MTFLKSKACGQKVLPDRSLWKEQKLLENTKMQKCKCDIWVDKSSLKQPNEVNLASLGKPQDSCQTVVPDRLLIMGQNIGWNAKIKKNV